MIPIHPRSVAALYRFKFKCLRAFAGLLLVLTAPLLLAQANAGVTGTVTDASGATVASAAVVITNQETGVSDRSVTSSAGTYTFRGLNPGTYKVEITAQGFRKEIKANIPVQVSVIGTIDFALANGAATEVVQVNADQIALNTTQPQIGTGIDPAVVDDLPVEVSGRGRQIDQLQFLAPGTTGDTFSHRVSGGVDFAQEILYNGIPVPQSETEGYTTNFNPPYDLVQELRVERTTFSAQFGLGQGALTYQMKSGTNSYHGNLFEINRNSFADSVGFNGSKAQGGSGRVPAAHQNNYGFTVGGPLTIPKVYNGHDRTFGLYSQEWFKQTNANTANGTVPTVLEKQGNFSDYVDGTGTIIPIIDPLTGNPFPGNTIPQSRISPLSASLLKYLPDPDRPGTGNGNLIGNKSYVPNSFPNLQHVWGFTVDHKLSDRQSLHYAQWRNSFSNTTFDSAPFVVAPNPLNSERFEPALGSAWLLNYSNALSDKLVTTVGFGWIGEINSQFNVNNGTPSPLTVTGPVAVPPNINFSNYSSWGDGGALTNSVNRKLGISVVNNWLWTRGRHTFNIGGEFRRTYQDDNEEQTAGGQFNFSSNQTSIHDTNNKAFAVDGNAFASYLLGLPDNVNRSNSQELKLRNLDFSPYIQDDIKLSPKLTVNLGLRWDIQVPFTEENNNVVYFNPNITNPAAISLTGQQLKGAVSQFGLATDITKADTHFGHFGPRIGFAYQLDTKTVLQGGFSVAFLNGGAYEYGTNKVAVNYGNLLVGSFQRNSTGSYVSSYGQWDNNPLLNPATTPYSPGLGTGNTVHAFDPKHDGYSPYSQQWNLNVQRQLPFRTFLTAAYVGNRTIHLPSNLNPINQLDPQYLALGNKLTDTFKPGQTQLDGVTLPYQTFTNDFGGGATVRQALSPYPQYSYIQNNFEGFGTTYYQGLQVEVDKRLSDGLSILVGYTLSHSLDNTGSGFSSFANGAVNKFNQKPEYVVSSSDEPQTVKVSGTYELPLGTGKRFVSHGIAGQLLGGVKTGFVLDYEAGTPFGVGSGQPGLNGNRPNRNANVPLSAHWGVAKQYLLGGRKGAIPQVFNPAAFTDTQPYVIGNALRNYGSLRFPWSANEDVSAQKSFSVRERYKGILKVDFFNVLNRSNIFYGYNGNTTDASFSNFIYGGAGNNRRGQATLRFEF